MLPVKAHPNRCKPLLALGFTEFKVYKGLRCLLFKPSKSPALSGFDIEPDRQTIVRGIAMRRSSVRAFSGREPLAWIA
jgi:hypothetical protein